MMSKHKMAANSVDTFVQRLLGEMAIRYYKANEHGFALIANLSLVSSGGTILYHHITLTSLLPLLSNSSMS